MSKESYNSLLVEALESPKRFNCTEISKSKVKVQVLDCINRTITLLNGTQLMNVNKNIL